jgi:hypothetical protein
MLLFFEFPVLFFQDKSAYYKTEEYAYTEHDFRIATYLPFHLFWIRNMTD